MNALRCLRPNFSKTVTPVMLVRSQCYSQVHSERGNQAQEKWHTYFFISCWKKKCGVMDAILNCEKTLERANCLKMPNSAGSHLIAQNNNWGQHQKMPRFPAVSPNPPYLSCTSFKRNVDSTKKSFVKTRWGILRICWKLPSRTIWGWNLCIYYNKEVWDLKRRTRFFRHWWPL